MLSVLVLSQTHGSLVPSYRGLTMSNHVKFQMAFIMLIDATA